MRWYGVCRWTTTREGHRKSLNHFNICDNKRLDDHVRINFADVAQEVLQLCRMPQTSGFYAGLRRSRQGDSLQSLLRKTFRPQRIRLRPRPNPRLHRCRTPSHIVSLFSLSRFSGSINILISISNFSSEGTPFTGAKAKEGSGCPRCGFPVYAAEQMISKNNIWHKRCFSCIDCHKSLVSTILYSPTTKLSKEDVFQNKITLDLERF